MGKAPTALLTCLLLLSLAGAEKGKPLPRLIYLKDPKLLHTLQGHTDPVINVDWSQDGRRLASGGDKTMNVWDAASGKLLQTPPGQTHMDLDMAWSPDGKRFAIGHLGQNRKDVGGRQRPASALAGGTRELCSWSGLESGRQAVGQRQ